jgi:ABC-type dipeptide/oligopeptide/nickel transport system permease subunit
MKLKQTYKQYWRNHKLLMVSLHILFVSLFLTNLIIGSKPIVCKYKGEWHAMIFYDKPVDGSLYLEDLSSIGQFDYRKLNYDFAIWPLLKLDPKSLHSQSAWLPPFTKNQNGHLYVLGSYDLGRDVFAGCIYGLHKSLWLALITILISGVFGIFIGSVFSFQSRRFERISILSAFLFVLSIFMFFYFILLIAEWKMVSTTLYLFFISSILFCIVMGFYFFDKTPQCTFKMDFIALRYIEIMKSIPVILILLILLQIIKNPGVISLAGLISIVYVPVIAKYARAFTLAASNEIYINSILVIGQSGAKIYIKHILPGLISEIIPILAFGVANIILLEASLSFLGLGISLDEISLGTMMYAGRAFTSAWWVIVFPGLLVFWLVSTFNTCGELWSDRKWIRDYQA